MAWTGRTILVVDDDEMIFKDLKRKLKNTNVTLLWAEDGTYAIEICKSNQVIDLIIMDIQMPKISGFEATKQIKQIRQNIPIVGQTSFVDPENIANSIKAGMSDFAIKPIEIEKISSLLKREAA